jgi:hypothetical protein
VAYSQTYFLISIKAPAVDFGFIQSSVPVTGSFWNGYGGRVVRTGAFQDDQTAYDAIFFISVLHIIPDPKYRQRVVKMAAAKIRPGGFIVVDVPQSETYYNRRLKKLPRHKDGYLLRWGNHYTFYKSFYCNELDAMFQKIPGLKLFKKIHYCKHLIRMWKMPG